MRNTGKSNFSRGPEFDLQEDDNQPAFDKDDVIADDKIDELNIPKEANDN